MATKRKSAKRTAGKKTSGSKRASARKKPARKKSAKRGASSKRTAGRKKGPLGRRVAKGLQAARGGIDSARQAGDKIWGALRSTTAQVVEEVKDRLGEDSDRNMPTRGS
jgi:hypothetical protein